MCQTAVAASSVTWRSTSSTDSLTLAQSPCFWLLAFVLRVLVRSCSGSGSLDTVRVTNLPRDKLFPPDLRIICVGPLVSIPLFNGLNDLGISAQLSHLSGSAGCKVEPLIL